MTPLIWMAGLAVVAATMAPSDTLTDPTKPVDYLPDSGQTRPLVDELADWRLTAVRISKDGNSAVLNGKIVRVGDIVGRARVADIKPGMVIVDLDRRQQDIRLHGAWVKKQTTHKIETPVKP